MLKYSYRISLFFALLLAFAGCATKPQTPAAVSDAKPSSIQAEATGLSPTGDERFKTISFAVLIGDQESVSSWKIAVVSQKQKTAVYTETGDQTNIPETFVWDGKDETGKLVAEGTYAAELTCEYGGTRNPGGATSKPFVLDITPPSASFAPNPARFPYAPDGVTSSINVAISAKPSLAKVASWNISIFDEKGTQIHALNGTAQDKQASWDGKLDQGGYVAYGKSYPAVLSVSDEYGNKGTFTGAFAMTEMPGAAASTITTRRSGFSPTSSSVKNTIDLLLSVGSKESMKSWKVDISSVEKGSAVPVKTFSGTNADLPEYVRWDGKDNAGTQVPEASYYATLSIDYGKAYKPAVVKSRNISVVMTPPAGSITVDPPSVKLSELGPKAPVNLTLQAKSAFAQIATWTMAVQDQAGTSVAVFNGNWPNNKIAWDGKTVDGQPLIPGSQYTVAAKVQDEYGNIGDIKGTLSIDSLNPSTEPSTIEASAAGFAPLGDGSKPNISFKIATGNAANVATWKVDIVSDGKVTARTWQGTGDKLPAMLTWDGKKDDGSYAPDGRYQAFLSLDYGVAYAPISVGTEVFILDITPPTGNISLSTKLFSPDGDGTNDTETIKIDGSSSLAKIVGWSLTAYDPGNNAFMKWSGNWPASAIAWDGTGQNGDLVESASDYPLVLKLRDEFGNIGTVKNTLSTDILVLKTDSGYRIRVSSIVFKAYTANYKDVPAERAARNLNTLDLLAAKLKLPKFVDYKVKLEGHAVMINWDNKDKGEAEQQVILIPLSKSRADAIEQAMIDRGVNGDRLVTDGVGADNPIVPDSDFADRWKNRRVEFYLLK